MPDDIGERTARLQPAAADELSSLIHDIDEQALLALLENPALAEPHVIQMLERLDLSANVLAAIAEKGKWTASEGVRLRLARHPRTPRRFALALLRQLYLFDLVRLTLLPATPSEIRRVAEELIVTRVPHLPVTVAAVFAQLVIPPLSCAMRVRTTSSERCFPNRGSNDRKERSQNASQRALVRA